MAPAAAETAVVSLSRYQLRGARRLATRRRLRKLLD
jgi:hypothetical protein